MMQRLRWSDRLAIAWKAIRGQPSRDGRPIQYKRSPLAWPAWRDGRPEWQMVDMRSYIEEGFNVNSLIYSAILYKARAATTAPLRAYQGDIDQPTLADRRSPLARLVTRPNNYQSGREFQALAQVYFNLSGNLFVHLDRMTRRALPAAMRTLRPDRVHIIPEGGGIKGYLYIPEGRGITDGVPILAEDMIHIKLPNPADPLEGMGYGLSPISPAAQSADVDNRVTGFLNDFFKRGTMLSTVLEFQEPIEDTDVARIRNRWREVYGGSFNWADIGIVDGGGKVNRLGMTFDEMGFKDIDSRNESRMLGPFGVPAILLGTRYGLERGTYSNFEEARKQFWQDTFVPELNWHEADYTFYLEDPSDGAYSLFDYSKVPALQMNIGDLADAAHKLWAMGVPRDMALDAVGLHLGKTPGGDRAYIPLNVVPVEPDGMPIQPEPVPGEGEEGEDGSEPGAKIARIGPPGLVGPGTGQPAAYGRSDRRVLGGALPTGSRVGPGPRSARHQPAD